MKHWKFAIILAVLCTILYDPTRWENSSGDTISARYWPIAVLKYHSITLNPFEEDFKKIRFSSVWNAKGERLHRGGWTVLLFTVPFYALADLIDLGGKVWTHDRINRISRWNAILFSILSVILLFYFLMKFVSPWAAFLSALGFAFGTWHWSMATQGLSSQNFAVFLHLVSFFVVWELLHTRSESRSKLMAFSLALIHFVIFEIRPSDLFLIWPAGLVVLSKKRLPQYLAPLLLLFPALFALNHRYYHHFLGFYGFLGRVGLDTWRANFWDALFGLLFSPQRGLWIFFPSMYFFPVLAWKTLPSLGLAQLREKKIWAFLTDTRVKNGVPVTFARIFVLGVATYLLSLLFVTYWHSTWSYGPRYLYDSQVYVWPVFAIMIDQLLAGKWTWGRPSVVTAIALIVLMQSVFVHALGHRNFDIWVFHSRFNSFDDRHVWSTDAWIIKDTFEAGSSRHRWPNAYHRLMEFGY